MTINNPLLIFKDFIFIYVFLNQAWKVATKTLIERGYSMQQVSCIHISYDVDPYKISALDSSMQPVSCIYTFHTTWIHTRSVPWTPSTYSR